MSKFKLVLIAFLSSVDTYNFFHTAVATCNDYHNYDGDGEGVTKMANVAWWEWPKMNNMNNMFLYNEMFY